MLNLFANKFKAILVTLRFSILTIFLTLFCVAILLLIALNYYESSKALLNMAENLMDKYSDELYQKIRVEFSRVDDDLVITANLIHNQVINPDNIGVMQTYLYDVAKNFYLGEEAYYGDEKGNLINVRYEPNYSLTTDIINRNKIPATRQIIYRDTKGSILKKINSNDLSFDPRNRPWYIDAKQAGKLIWTNIYYFKTNPYFGISGAIPIFNINGSFQGVVGIDIPIAWLSWDLRRYSISPHSLEFVAAMDGTLIAFPKIYEGRNLTKLVNIHSITMPWIAKAFEIYLKNSISKFNFVYKGKTYIANFRTIPQFRTKGWVIGIVAPKDDFIGHLKMNSIIDALIGLCILLFGGLLISELSSRISNPIKTLANQTDKIRHFDLEQDQKVKSRIKEVFMLSNAITVMRSSLKSFKKYVPTSLVRQLIETGEDAVIGGTKKSLTIFFSDIENFVTISERMDPQLLMEHLCEYFNEMSNILIAEGAVIDKFIGDSIMAFWGAPTPIDNPCHRAAQAALKCKARLETLNTQWSKAGKPPLYTRMGINTGEAIVGNVGSDDRLNYTALGGTINTASRLEQLNKTYHTQIIVSDAVYQIIKDSFVLKKLGHVSLKGMVEAIDVYELIAEK